MSNIQNCTYHNGQLREDWTQGELPVVLSRVTTEGQIVAIGRNYADHAKELGNAIPKGESTPTFLTNVNKCEAGLI